MDILIVDDEATNCTLLEQMLSAEGCRLRSVASGEEALDAVADDPPDLILLDVLMPGIGGYEAAARLKYNGATKNIPIIMVSALDDREAKISGLVAGAEDFLAKPVDGGELRFKVRNLLRLKAHADNAVANRDHSMGMVSHELRNMLSGIVLSARVLAQQAGPARDAETQERMARLQGFATRMDRLIGDLVDVVSIEAGKLFLKPERWEAALVLREIVEALAPAAELKGLTLTCAAPAPRLAARFDRERVLQVLTNLVMNAIKFTPGGGSVTLAAAVAGEDLLFSVTDTGPGIPRDQLDAVFERFRQLGDNDKRGLGLGLYISKCIVESHGGRIWVESSPGAGSTFRFTIPGALTAALPAPAATVAKSHEQPARVPGSQGRVLVLDDDQAMCETLSLYLARRGFTVAWRTSPVEALALVAQRSFDVVVADLHMKHEMDGIAFCKAAVAACPGLPVIVTTAFAADGTNAAAIDVGAYEFLSKPFDPHFLEVMLSRAVASGAASQPRASRR
jgi:signal transduction histidine kinase